MEAEWDDEEELPAFLCQGSGLLTPPVPWPQVVAGGAFSVKGHDDRQIAADRTFMHAEVLGDQRLHAVLPAEAG
jgi:hypothetical protein